jgi:hypothetical protein
MRILLTLIGALAVLAAPWRAADGDQTIAKELGKSGQEMAGGVYRVGLPRTDLDVALDSVKLRPAFKKS